MNKLNYLVHSPKFGKLLQKVQTQIAWLCMQLIDPSSRSDFLPQIIVGLLKQIRGGDLSRETVTILTHICLGFDQNQ
jgi:hypothetical protein